MTCRHSTKAHQGKSPRSEQRPPEKGRGSPGGVGSTSPPTAPLSPKVKITSQICLGSYRIKRGRSPWEFLSQMCHRVYKKNLRVTRGQFQTIFKRHAWEPQLAGNTVEQEGYLRFLWPLLTPGRYAHHSHRSSVSKHPFFNFIETCWLPAARGNYQRLEMNVK